MNDHIHVRCYLHTSIPHWAVPQQRYYSHSLLIATVANAAKDTWTVNVPFFVHLECNVNISLDTLDERFSGVAHVPLDEFFERFRPARIGRRAYKLLLSLGLLAHCAWRSFERKTFSNFSTFGRITNAQ